MGLHGPLCLLNQARGGGIALPAALAAAVAGLAVPADDHMARLAGGQSAPELPVYDNACSHAGAQGYHGKVPGPLPRTAEELAYRGAVRVVTQQQGQIQMLPEELFQRDILHGDVGGEQHVAAVRRPGQAHAHPPDLILHNLFGELRQGLRKALRPLEIQGNPLHLHNSARLVHQTGF